MKNYFQTTFFLLIILVIISCKKDRADIPGSTPVDFTEITYDSLGTYDIFGKPNYLVEPDVISADFLAAIEASLPEQKDIRSTNPNYLTKNNNADIAISTKTDVWVTFVTEGTGFRNSIAFYTFPSNNPPLTPGDIKKVTYIFPNAKLENRGGDLKPGDKVKIGTFQAGTSIGFVLLQNAFNKDTRIINTKIPHFLSNDKLNPENDPDLKKHTVILNYEDKKYIGFEDLDRSTGECDHDFNDVVIYITQKAAQ